MKRSAEAVSRAMEVLPELSDAWLSSLLGRSVEIEGVERMEDEGNSTSILLKLRCKEATTLVLKVTREAKLLKAGTGDRQAMLDNFAISWPHI